MARNKKTSKKKNKQKKKIITSIVVIIIIIAICVIARVTSPKYKVEKKLKEINVADKMSETMVIPDYLNRINEQYTGDMSTQIIAKTYNNFAESIIPKYNKKCKNMGTEELRKYFNKNKKIILIELGYNNFNDFNAFINQIKTLSGDKLELEEYRIAKTTVKKEDGKVTAYLLIKYKNNQQIAFKTKLQNQVQKNKTSIDYSCDVDKEKVQKDNDEEAEDDEDVNIHGGDFIRGYPVE